MKEIKMLVTEMVPTLIKIRFIPVYERDQNAGDRDGPHMPNTS
jgi:hypothetical protein